MNNPDSVALQRDIDSRRVAFFARPQNLDDVDHVRAWLKLMFDIDQMYRDLYVFFVDHGDEVSRQELGPAIKRADADHRQQLARWLTDREWPRISRFGAEASRHAWMIALHADAEVAFQKRVLAAMEPLLAEREVDPAHYAALSDRIAIMEARPQRFGMFYRVVDGREESYPAEAPDVVLANRARLGLGDARFRR